jgi:predicted nucleic acid-binding protein
MRQLSEAEAILQEALEVMTKRNEDTGMSWTDARRNAYAGMFGMLGYNTSKKYAKKVLQIAKEW